HGEPGCLGHDLTRSRDLRSHARGEPECDLPGLGKYRGFWRTVRVFIPPQPRLVAPHRAPFRVELHPAVIWPECQRAYNENNGLGDGVVGRAAMEWRRLRPRRWHPGLWGNGRSGCIFVESSHSPATLAAPGPARGEYGMRTCASLAILSLLPVASFAAGKLTMEDRIELTRGLTAEYATVKQLLPRSKKPLPYGAAGG